jgi:hypothetical protein
MFLGILPPFLDILKKALISIDKTTKRKLTANVTVRVHAIPTRNLMHLTHGLGVLPDKYSREK